MLYQGSKKRLVKYILPIILEDRTEDQWFVEPFCGGCNVTEHVKGNVLAGDSNPCIIAYFQAITQGWRPPVYLDESEWRDIKTYRSKYPPELIAFAGVACSYGGRWFEGYARSKSPRKTKAQEGYANAEKQGPKLGHVKFIASPYYSLPLPPNSIIYCDPPYENTKEYRDSFCHGQFWEWCRYRSRDGHKVFVSELNAPDDFKCVWSQEISVNLASTRSKKTSRVEKLFTFKGEVR